MSTMILQPVSDLAFRSNPVAAPDLRLTRRGRVVVLAVALLALLAAGLLWSTTSAASDASTGFPTRVVQVAPGDTLWAIADDVAGGGSTREMVTTIEGLNKISAGLQSGQRLVVPLR